MKRAVSPKIIIVLCLIALFFPANISIADSNNVYFSEIAWAGSSVSASDEWFELKNNSLGVADLTNWQVTRWNNSTSTEVLMLNLSGIIPGNGNFLVGNNSANYNFSGGQSTLQNEPNLIVSSLALSNDNFQLRLYDGNFTDGRLPVDIAGDKSTPLAGSNNPKSSMVRRIPLGNGSEISSWYSSNVSEGFDNPAVDFGTPGLTNKSKPYVNISCDKTMVARNKTTSVNCSGMAYDYNDEKISVVFRYNNKNETLNIENGKWNNTISINPTNDFKIFIDAINGSTYLNSVYVAIATYTLSDKITINEAMPDPDTGEEWIEIYNQGDQDLDLTGWQLDDKINAGSSPFYFDRQTIKAGQFSYLPKSSTGIWLNNDGDEIYLIDPEGTFVDHISYEDARKNKSWTKTSDRAWVWTDQTTQGEDNRLPEGKNYFGLIKINEILPNPAGSDENGEWVEILSLSDSWIDLSGWSLDDEDGGSTAYKFPASFGLEPHQYLVVKRSDSKIAFNNDGDEIRLFAPDETLVDKVIYANVEENHSYSAFKDGWEWTNHSTPGIINIKSVNEKIDTPLGTVSSEIINFKNEIVASVSKKEVAVIGNIGETLPDHPLERISPIIKESNDSENGKVLGIDSRKSDSWYLILFLVYLSGIIFFWKINLWQIKYLLKVKKNWKELLRKLKPG